MRYDLETLTLILFYLWGFAVVFMQAACVATMVLIGIQLLAMGFGELYDWGAIFRHLLLSLYLMMLFPGQRVWTVRLRGPGDAIYTIVGDPDCDSEA